MAAKKKAKKETAAEKARRISRELSKQQAARGGRTRLEQLEAEGKIQGRVLRAPRKPRKTGRVTPKAALGGTKIGQALGGTAKKLEKQKQRERERRKR